MTAATRKKDAVDTIEEGPAPDHYPTGAVTLGSPGIGTIVEVGAGQPQRTPGSIVADIEMTMIGTKRLTGSLAKEGPFPTKRSAGARVSHQLTGRRRMKVKRRVFRYMMIVVLSSLRSNCLKSRT